MRNDPNKMAMDMANLLGDEEVLDLALHAAREAGIRLADISKNLPGKKSGAALIMSQVILIAMLNKWFREKKLSRSIIDGLIEVADHVLEDIRKGKKK